MPEAQEYDLAEFIDYLPEYDGLFRGGHLEETLGRTMNPQQQLHTDIAGEVKLAQLVGLFAVGFTLIWLLK